MYALDLAGGNIGNPLSWVNTQGKAGSTGDDVVTMITHRKDGHVLVRYGKRNAQATLHPLTEITRVVGPE